MAQSYDRRINLYINVDGKQVNNNVKSIRGEMSKIMNAQRQMTIGSSEYIAQTKKIQFLQGILDKHRVELQNVQKSLSFKGMAEGFNKYVGIVVGGVAAVAGFIYKMNQAVQASDNFNDKLANLSAITGLAGADLEWLGNKAKEMSTSTLEGGVNITKSADDIVDAFTKMGSARPELLKNKDALAQVTEKALILAEASKMDMQPAIEAVAASMNQFNLDASQSERIINAIAAGSLEGSAEVADLTESMKNVGTVANDSNMSLEQTIAALEVLGEKQLKGAEAGTKLRGAMLQMKDAGVGYASGQFNLRDALEEVNVKLAAQGGEMERDALKIKVFGKENITAGSILLQNIEKYDQLTVAVTGTNTAYEQAAKNTNTDIALKKQAINEYHNAAIELGKNLSPAVTAVYRGLGLLARSFAEVIAIPISVKLRDEQFELNNLVHSIVSVNDNQKIRNGLIQELLQKHPGFIGNIDAEKVSNEQLLEKLTAVNKAYLERIRIAVNEEDITANEKKMQKVWKEQRELIKDVDVQYQRLVVNKKENASFDEKIAAIAKTNSTVQGYGSVSYASNAGIANLQKDRWLTLTEKGNALEVEYNDLLKERETINPTPEVITPPPGGGKTPGTPSGNPGAAKVAGEALELAYKQQQLTLKQKYAGDETIQKEYQARMLANELAFLKSKLQITTDESSRVDLQSQIIDKELLFTAALKEATPELMLNRDQINQRNVSLLEEAKLLGLASQQQEKGTAAQEAATVKQKQHADTIKMVGDVMTDYVTGALDGSLDGFQSFGDTLVLMSLQILKQMVPIWSAQILGLSLASPESVATWGVAGMAKYAVITGLMYAGIAAVEGAVKSGISKKREVATANYASGGFTGAGGKYEMAGVVHKGEWVANSELVKHPIAGPIIAGLESMRTNPTVLSPAMVGFTSGGFTSEADNIIDRTPRSFLGRYALGFSPIDDLQNELLKKLAIALDGNTSAGSSGQSSADPELKMLLAENAKAIKNLTTWEPSISIEEYERKRKNYEKVTSGGLK